VQVRLAFIRPLGFRFQFIKMAAMCDGWRYRRQLPALLGAMVGRHSARVGVSRTASLRPRLWSLGLLAPR
jgi:hypothetical protein